MLSNALCSVFPTQAHRPASSPATTFTASLTMAIGVSAVFTVALIFDKNPMLVYFIAYSIVYTLKTPSYNTHSTVDRSGSG